MSIFSRIAAGEIPSYKVAADDRHFAFSTSTPWLRATLWWIPRREVDYLFDLTPQEYADLWAFAREVALKLKRLCRARGSVWRCWAWRCRTPTSIWCRFRAEATWISVRRNSPSRLRRWAYSFSDSFSLMSNIYDIRRRGTVIFLIITAVVMAVFLWVSDSLVSDLAEQERAGCRYGPMPPARS